MSARPVEILCAACGREALLRREPRFEGFRKVGERLFCSACGHEFADDGSVPFKGGSVKPAVFTDADRPRVIEVFREDEKHRVCRYCRHYVVNPFTQRCSLHQRVVEATDTCGDFIRKPEPGQDAT